MTTDGQVLHAAWPGLFGAKVALDDIAPGPPAIWAAAWFDGSTKLTDVGGEHDDHGLATERSLVGSRVAYDPLTGRPVVIWSQGDHDAGYQIVAG